MIIARFGLYGIKIKRGMLFGDMRQYPLLSVHFLFVYIAFIRGSPVGVFREAIMGLAEDRDWLIKNARAVRIEKKKARSKEMAKMEAQYRSQLESAYESMSEYSRKNGELQNEVYALRRVIKGLSKENGND